MQQSKMNKEHILNEIKRTAEENGGHPLGIGQFLNVTGIKKNDWYGKYWTKWSDAQREAGYEPNTLQVPYEENFLIEHLVLYTRELGSFPTKPELKIKGFNDSSFPNYTTFGNRLGTKKQMACKVVEYCNSNPGFEDVKEIAKEVCGSSKAEEELDFSEESIEFGFVYLMKSGKYYKIGRSNNSSRRNYELNIQMPEEVILIHEITTDDPVGIEAYWHKRFDDKRKKGEWFQLDVSDISAFKRRKFM